MYVRRSEPCLGTLTRPRWGNLCCRPNAIQACNKTGNHRGGIHEPYHCFVRRGLLHWRLSQRSQKLQMAADAAGITMGDAVCPRTSPGTTGQGTGVTTRIAAHSCGLISGAAATRGDTPHLIRATRHGTAARRTTRFRMGCVSLTRDVKPLRPPQLVASSSDHEQGNS